jgi:photosystem II stability/assembly factor-like uncharacterized protein
MAIEDRLRAGLRRTAARVPGDEQLPDELWRGVGKGIQRARRRQVTMFVATVGFSLALFAGIMAWVVVAFTGSGRQSGDHGAGLSVERVRVYGTRDGIAKIYGTVTNHGSRAVGAQLTCQVFDASGHPIGTATGSLLSVGAGRAQPFGPLGGGYPGTPSSARCSAVAIPPVAPSPSQAAAPAFQPTAVAFWNAQDGILSGSTGQPECSPRCTWSLEVTRDGGKSWQKVFQPQDFVYDVAVYGSSDAWALSGPCAMGTCQIHVLFSGDGGRTWHQQSTTDLKKVSFVSPTEGWGVGDVFPTGSQRIAHTTDGGRTWQSRSVPCPSLAPFAMDVSFGDAARGWLLCTGVGGAGNENRAIVQTTNGGQTWTVVAEASIGGHSSSGLTASGYPNGIAFLSDGHGWMSADRSRGIQATTDGGRSWRVVGTVPNGASTSIGSLAFLTDTDGFALLANGDQQVSQLIQSRDGGQTWRVVSSWPYEPVSPSPSRAVIAHGTDAGIAWVVVAIRGADGVASLEVNLPGQNAPAVLQEPTGRIPDLWVSSVSLGTGPNAKMLVFGFVAVRVSSVHIEPTGEIGATYVIPGERQIMAFVVVASPSSNATVVAEDEGGAFLAQEHVGPA